MEKSSVFEETYTNYLAQIDRLDFKKIADQLGAEMISDEMIIPFEYLKLAADTPA